MTTVTDEDVDVANTYWSAGSARTSLAEHVAGYPERIDARVRAECTTDLIERDRRIAELESQLSSARDLTKQFKAAWKLAESRITELSKQLANMSDPSHYSSKDGRIRDLEATITKRNTFIVELESQLAAAKPVLTADQAHEVDTIRKRDAHVCDVVRLCDLVDAAYARPKAPPTDAELALDVALVMGVAAPGSPERTVLEAVHDALRARGAK